MSETQKAEAETGLKWRGLLETLSRLVVGLIGLAYVIGLLILNWHVRKYGIYYLNFLQIEYVMVGMLWACLVGSVYCLLIASFGRAKQIYEAQKWKARFLTAIYLLLTLFGGFISLVVVISILTEAETVRVAGNWKIIGVLCLNAIAVYNVGSKVLQLRTHLLSERAHREKHERFAQLFDVFYTTVLLVVVLGAYSGAVFPRISPTFGGGKPQKAEFLIKADRIDTVKAIGFQLSEGTPKVGPLEVVFEASDFFLIIPPQGFTNDKIKAIRLNKDLIDAAFYLK
jgi:hypothetical protein